MWYVEAAISLCPSSSIECTHRHTQLFAASLHRFDPATNRCEGGDTEMEEISGVDLRSALRMKRMQQLQPIGEVQGECTPGDSAKRRKAERKGAWH